MTKPDPDEDLDPRRLAALVPRGGPGYTDRTPLSTPDLDDTAGPVDEPDEDEDDPRALAARVPRRS